MLNPVECMEEPPPVAPPSPTRRPRPGAVWVHSKGQPPYEFCPYKDPCSPHEWPYNLEVLRGTEDYEDILAWFFKKQPDVLREEISLFLTLLDEYVGPRSITVAVSQDMDTGCYHLLFTVWDLLAERPDDEPAALRAFDRRWLGIPALGNLLCKVLIRWRESSFDGQRRRRSE
ncbi:hypothetical protein [Mitsuaria sp. GD03876]|uniref:hypothetical protein n=1 Tax=Mitsuaria sp. GD03876 TaxID=2975399 RepID=UPI00244B9937|nr:hypothetical protein [Mitsuaria sp. GD03876]MDH0868185.1 hypothetical protein [Mitsuaria sp. GD03876]